MRKLLHGREFLDNYVDDVLTHTPDWQNHLKAIRDFLTTIRNARLTLKPSKCVVGSSTVPYLGHNVGDSKLEPNQS